MNDSSSLRACAARAAEKLDSETTYGAAAVLREFLLAGGCKPTGETYFEVYSDSLVEFEADGVRFRLSTWPLEVPLRYYHNNPDQAKNWMTAVHIQVRTRRRLFGRWTHVRRLGDLDALIKKGKVS